MFDFVKMSEAANELNEFMAYVRESIRDIQSKLNRIELKITHIRADLEKENDHE